MAGAYFVARERCPACASTRVGEICRKSYLSAELEKYLADFYCPQGTVEPEYLSGAEYVLCECADCGVFFQQDIPNDELMVRLYEHWINPKTALENRRSHSLEHFQKYAGEITQIASLFDRPPAQLRFLDFGMGWGEWALLAKAHGIDAYGTELSNERMHNARLIGIKVIEWGDIPSGNFDFINTEQVFEHIANPLDTLRHLKCGLKEGGIIKISVPYARDIEKRLKRMDWEAPKGAANSLNPVAPLEHINYFRRKSIVKMGAIAGMKEIVIPIARQYAQAQLFNGGVKGLLKNLARPVFRNTVGNYVLLKR